jgi:hypothetical protein
MMQGRPSNAPGAQIGVRHLNRHADRKGQIRKVRVLGIVVAEVDAALGRTVIEPRIAE